MILCGKGKHESGPFQSLFRKFPSFRISRSNTLEMLARSRNKKSKSWKGGKWLSFLLILLADKYKLCHFICPLFTHVCVGDLDTLFFPNIHYSPKLFKTPGVQIISSYLFYTNTQYKRHYYEILLLLLKKLNLCILLKWNECRNNFVDSQLGLGEIHVGKQVIFIGPGSWGLIGCKLLGKTCLRSWATTMLAFFFKPFPHSCHRIIFHHIALQRRDSLSLTSFWDNHIFFNFKHCISIHLAVFHLKILFCNRAPMKLSNNNAVLKK